MGALLVAAGTSPIMQAQEKEPSPGQAADALLKAELAKLKGSWRAVRGELSGEPRKESFLLTFSDAIWTKTGEKSTETGVYHINPSASPKQIDFLRQEGKKKWLLGIYTLEGDTLKFCYGPERPSALATKSGQKALLLEFRRELASKDPKRSDK
jgi:uncharacterized protein (TIGR03067 family)